MWTISLNVLCVKCRQRITEQDLTQNNYQLILLPVFSFHHQVCPSPQSNPQRCFFGTILQEFPEINLNFK